MKNKSLQEKAIELRRKGLSYSEILKEIPVAKSTLSLWLRSVGLSKKQHQVLTAKKLAGILRGGAARKNQRLKLTEIIHEEAEEQTKDFNLRDLWYIGIALYWAEGAKEKIYRVSQRVTFSNSDADMIAVFLDWLDKCMHIPKERISCDLYIHKNNEHRLNDIIEFWSQKTGFPIEHFSHIYFKKNVPKRKYRKNTGLLYNGLLRVNISGSTDFNRRITGWIKGIVKNCGIV